MDDRVREMIDDLLRRVKPHLERAKNDAECRHDQNFEYQDYQDVQELEGLLTQINFLLGEG